MKPGRENAAGIHIGAGLSGYCAEMTSALLGADLGLPTAHIDDHAAYIGSWLAVLRKDSRAIMTAAAKAEAAAAFLLRATGLATSDEVQEQIREAA